MKSKKYIFYITMSLQIILGLLFLAAGLGKFLASDVWIQKFMTWGYPDYFNIFIGIVELLAAIILFIPKLTKYSASVLVVIMLGAMITHLIHQEWLDFLRPFVYSIFLSTVVYLKTKFT